MVGGGVQITIIEDPQLFPTVLPVFIHVLETSSPNIPQPPPAKDLTLLKQTSIFSSRSGSFRNEKLVVTTAGVKEPVAG